MGKKYSALYMSLALHFGVVALVLAAMPYVLKSPPEVSQTTPISIEFIPLTIEAVSIDPVKGPAEQEVVQAAAEPIIDEKIKVAIQYVQVADHLPTPPSEEEIREQLETEFRQSYFAGEDGELVSMADWVMDGLTKNQAEEKAPDGEHRKFLGQIARSLQRPKEVTGENPLLGDGQYPQVPRELTRLRIKTGDESGVRSVISPRHKRRKQGAYTGGIYASGGLADVNSAGASVISYEANISNCAHEEARTGINRCRAFERWIGQKLVEALKEQGRK